MSKDIVDMAREQIRGGRCLLKWSARFIACHINTFQCNEVSINSFRKCNAANIRVWSPGRAFVSVCRGGILYTDHLNPTLENDEM